MSRERRFERLLASREHSGPITGLFVALLGVATTMLVVACAAPHVFDSSSTAASPDAPSASTGGVAGEAGSAAGGGTEEVTVTASRISPGDSRDRRAARAAPAAQQAQKAPGSERAAGAAMAGVAPFATQTSSADGAGALGREMRQNGVAGTLFSRVQPGEEIWVIETIAVHPSPAAVEDDQPGSGALLAVVNNQGPDRPQVEVPLPLQHTDVHAVVTGYIGSVDVTQQFSNPYDEKIEAVYLFPLPEKAAVSEFVMTIGERKIRGILREKEEAKRIYEDARAQGYRASLLVQHRPNVFEQKVANIEPGKQIDVNIRYFHTLAYEDGWYSFVFPTVVGPRYNPTGSNDPVAALPRGVETNPVYERMRHPSAPVPGTAVRYLRPAERSAHDLSLAVDLDAGVAIEELAASHAITTKKDGPNRAHVTLASASTIPNRDFVLRFRVAGERIKSSFVKYTDPKSKQGYFTLMVYPPADSRALARRPLEMVFVIDTSGSMAGRPLAQATAAVSAALDKLDDRDTFQIMNFSTSVRSLAAAPLAATRENRELGRRYLHSLAGDGGTEMLGGIRASLNYARDPQRDRYVAFLTDGYIGNEVEIFSEVHRLIGNARIFSFGVGNSVNRYLLDGLAFEGRGAAAYLALEDSADEVMQFYFDRISQPVLTDVSIDWRGLSVSEVYPRRLPDLFVGRPIIVTGKFKGDVDTISVRGRTASGLVTLDLVPDPGARPQPAVRSLWARIKIDDLTRRYQWSGSPDLVTSISSTALEYGLMSSYTSFVAVDASERTSGDHGTTVNQAVPVPDGVQYRTTVASRPGVVRQGSFDGGSSQRDVNAVREGP